MKIFLSILLTISPVLSFAQIRTNNKVAAFNRVEGAVVVENYSQNQSFDKDLNGVTTFGGTPSIVTTAGVKLVGAGSLQWATAANTDILQVISKPFPIGTNGLNCQTSFIYATPSGGPVSTQEFTAYVANNAGTNISGTVNLPATFDIAGTQTSKTVTLYYPCPYVSATPANSYVNLVVKHTASNSTSIIFDELMMQQANSLGAGVPNNVFSAKVTGGVVSDENEDFINGNCGGPSAPYTCNFVSGKFNVAPNCVVAMADISTGSYVVISSQATTSSITMQTGTTAGSNRSFNITCIRAGSDFIQPTITPNQWNYGPRAYTPTFTGFGTVTNIECTEARDGVWNLIDCKFTAGTTTATEARVSLPTGNTSVSLAQGIRNTGGILALSANQVAADTVLIESNVNYLTFGAQGAGASGLTKLNGSSLVTSGTTISFQARVQISGWTENQNAPQLLGSVTSNATSALREEYAFFTCSSSSSLGTVSSPNVFTAIGNVSGGGCAVTIASGVYSSAPHCDISLFSSTSSTEIKLGAAPTQTSVLPTCTTTSAGCTVWQGSVKCTGPR